MPQKIHLHTLKNNTTLQMTTLVIYELLHDTSKNDSQKRLGDFNNHLALSTIQGSISPPFLTVAKPIALV